MVFIYGTNDESPLFEDAGLVVGRVLKGHELLSSLFVRAELLVYPLRQMDRFSVTRIDRLFESDAVRMLQFEEAAVSTFALLRGWHAVKALDALHLATAASAGADLFVTNDHQLLKLSVTGIGRMVSIEDALGLV